MDRAQALTQQKSRVRQKQYDDENAAAAMERRQQEAEAQKAEDERLKSLLAEPSPGIFGRLIGKRSARFEIANLANMDDVDKREGLIRKGLERTTSKVLMDHLLDLKTQLKTKKKRHEALLELEKLDARAIPMLFDMYFREDHSEKISDNIYRAMGQIPDERSLFYFACYLPNWDANWLVANLIRKVDKLVGGFDKLSMTDQVRCYVGWRNGDALKNIQQETDRVLLGDLASGIERNRNFGLFALIGLGDQDRVTRMIEILDAQEDKELAEAFLNCGHSDLVTAGENWCRVHGYDITKGGDRPPVKWGSF